ncbi:MAG: cytochrome c biogenesis protein CcsA [Coriobacteriia bacterium]|nr:cytochrome c biogenesis protein CcsA [Coriobacteriia bacterium]
MFFGKLALWLGLITALVAICALWWGHYLGRKDGEAATNLGYYATFASFISFTLSVLTLVAAFFGNNYKLLYVAENRSTDVSSLAWLYKLAGVWAGREGSLLFWTWLIAVFAAYVAWRRMEKTDALSNMGLLVTNVVLSLFSLAMLCAEINDPFKLTSADMLSASGELLANTGMNPLLQHWAMILHPPTLFVGYAGLVIPFAFAMAALIVNDSSSEWVEIVDRITLFSWLFLSIGIGLGSVWAYVVLGWGGYWAWDPVENASFLPWLTGVGLIHSFTVYRRRGGFKRWALLNAAMTFSLVVLGTFITRSGIVQSVHAFQPDSFSTWLFGFMIAGPLVFIGLGLVLRWKSFAGNDEFESLTSKESAYYFNNVLMLLAAAIVAYLTVTSALPAWLPFGKQSISAITFDLLARPVGILYAIILAVCPILAWRKTEGATFWKRVRWPLATAAVIFAALVAEWWLNLRPIYDFMVGQGGTKAIGFTAFGPPFVYHGLALLAFATASVIIANGVWLFIEGTRQRAAAKKEGIGTALQAILFKARSQSGGYIAHIGMGIILIGLVGSAMYVRDVKMTVPADVGSSFTVSNYTLTFKSADSKTHDNGDVDDQVTFAVSKNGRNVGTVTPGRTTFALQNQTRLNAAVLSEPLRDIFMVWEGTQPTADGGYDSSINVKINPLIWFAWGGFGILLLGSALATWPKKTARLAPATASSASARRAKAGGGPTGGKKGGSGKGAGSKGGSGKGAGNEGTGAKGAGGKGAGNKGAKSNKSGK